jgi:hypothetical protein
VRVTDVRFRGVERTSAKALRMSANGPKALLTLAPWYAAFVGQGFGAHAGQDRTAQLSWASRWLCCGMAGVGARATATVSHHRISQHRFAGTVDAPDFPDALKEAAFVEGQHGARISSVRLNISFVEG